VAAGNYRFANSPCCCGGVGDDVCIAQIDRYGLPLNSVLCLQCGTVRTDPYLDDASLDEFYSRHYQHLYGRNKNLPQLFDYQRVHYGDRIAALYASQLTADSAVLEVGCGTGGATLAFAHRGCFVAGCDFSPELVSYGSSLGIGNLWIGPVDAAPAQADRQYNLVYLFHVLEHVQKPAHLLAQLRDRLTPYGRILAVVPDLFRIDVHRNPAGDALKFLHIAHKYNFSVEGLACMARQARLSAVRIVPPPRDEAALEDSRHLSELWIEFVPSTAAAGGAPLPTGHDALQKLLATERLFLEGRCPAQIEMAAREPRVPQARPRKGASPNKPPKRWYDKLPLVRAARGYWARRNDRAA
jgi:SAM-dependent methyltransferase